MPELVPLSPTVSLVPAPRDGRFPYANSLLIQDGGVTALVDTGCGHDTLRALDAAHRIDMIICTHSHLDHTGGSWLFPDRPIWMPEGVGFETAGDVQQLVARFVGDESLHELWLASTVPYTGYRNAAPTHAYPPGHVFEIGNTKLHSIPAPGHLSDHTCFWEPQAGLLLTTDIDFTGFGPWYANPESDPDAFEDSVRRVWALEPQVAISSHKGLYRGAALDEAFECYLGHFPRRDAAIRKAVAEPRTLAELEDMAIIYGRYPRAEPLLRYFERQMVEKHLRRLARRGEVCEVEMGMWQAQQGRNSAGMA